MAAVRLWVETLLVVIALIGGIAPLPPQLVERWFSTGIYPRIQHVITPLSNRLPFAVFDCLVLIAIVGLVIVIWRTIRHARAARALRPVLLAAGHLAAVAAAIYLVFLGLWGFNYRRVPMRERLEVQAGVPSSDAVMELGRTVASRLNALHASAHAGSWGEPQWRHTQLLGAFDAAQRLLSDAPPATPGRLKRTIFGPYFRWTSVDGMVDPFALEVLANPDLLPWERPFVAAHEWAHLAGYADESEANFVGWLTCLRADAPAQYSGWLYLFWEISGAVGPANRVQLLSMLDRGPRRDVDAIIARLRRGQIPLLRNTSWEVYDTYLKANRVDKGIRSYGEVVTLILRARFADGWTPVRRASAASR